MSDIIIPAFPPFRLAKISNPQTLTYYGSEHIGKTDAATKLPGSVRIIELQPRGGDHLAGNFLDLHALTDKGEFGRKKDGTPVDYDDAFFAYTQWMGDEHAAGRPVADFVVFDRIDRIEEWVFSRALKSFRKTLIGSSDKFKDLTSVTDVPGQGNQGSPGWRFVREEMHRVMWLMQRCAKYVVLITGMRDKMALASEVKRAGDAMPNDIDLIGGLRKLVCNESSSFGFMYRNATSELLLNFRSSDTTTCGTYCQHLRGREFVIGRVNNKMETIYDWSQIYLPDEAPAPAPAP